MEVQTWKAFPEKNPIKLWSTAPGFDPELGQDEPTLTPYLLGGKGRGCVIVLPGGGYGMKALHEAEPIAQAMNGLGYSSFVLDYRVSPYRYPLPQQDARRAVRYVRSHAEQYGIDPDKIAVLGFSAGGHLAACTGVFWEPGDADAADPVERASSRPDAMILCYPVIDLVGEARHEGSAQNLLGDLAKNKEQRIALCPHRHVTAETSPTFLWHTAEDGVSCENSELMFHALREKEVHAELHIFAKGNHGLGLAYGHMQVQKWVDLLGGFLRELGF